MSINVTVTGNPVNIKKGKMVCADPDYATKEFQKRRRMRLEQVRQQSKDIAENVRDKVRKEKKKQRSEKEEQGACKLKEWQNRKLLELQEQYCECLKDIGLGHLEGALEETRDDIMTAYKDVLREKSKERGYVAARQLHDDKSSDTINTNKTVQRKKFARDIENVRSAMVSKLKQKKSPFKKKKKKKSTTNINISSVVSDSDTNVDSNVNVDTSSGFDTSSSPHRPKSSVTETGETTTASVVKVTSPKESKIGFSRVPEVKRSPTRKTRSRSGSPEKTKSPLKRTEERTELPARKLIHFPLDTRISDRIKRRLNIPLDKSICDSHFNHNVGNKHMQNVQTTAEPSKPCAVIDICSQIQSLSPKADFYGQPCNINQDSNTHQYRVSRPCDDIPVKPKIGSRSFPKSDKSRANDLNKVQYYDHSNRYSKEYWCDNSCVQKIPDDSIQPCPSTISEREFFVRDFKRDRDAQERGKKAMEKEKIHKDYRQLMQQLPILQRQERVASINSNNPLFHMSDERLKLYELKKQNQMEGAYEKCFPNTPLITIPPKNHSIQTEPFRTFDIRESEPVSNLATWDVDSVNKVTKVTKEDGFISLSTEAPCDKTEYLRNLLGQLKMQKELLLREVDSLPKDSNLHNIINELTSFEAEVIRQKNGDILKKASCSVESTTGDNAECYCPDNAPCISVMSSTSKGAKKFSKKIYSYQRIKHKKPVNSSSSLSPRKKSKHRNQVLVLQNMSTQTTPKRSLTETNKSQESVVQVPQVQPLSPRRQKMLEGHLEVQIGGDRPKQVDVLASKKTAPSKRSQTAVADRLKSPAESTSQFQRDEAETKRKTKQSQTEVRTSPPKKSKSSVSKRSKLLLKSDSNSYVLENRRPCDCKDAFRDEVCEILIKIKDDESEIVIKSPSKTQKPFVVKADVLKSAKIQKTQKRLQFETEKPREEEKAQAPVAKTGSWRECFSKNGSLGTSTSTSYYSPPDFAKEQRIAGNRHNAASDDARKIDPRLLVYVKKLLTMSRASVEDLGVSTVSDISTPASSLMTSEKNDPLNQLKNIMKYFNLNSDELARCLNYSDETGGDATRNYTSTSSGSSVFVSREQHTSAYDASVSRTNASDNQSRIDVSKSKQKFQIPQGDGRKLQSKEKTENQTAKRGKDELDVGQMTYAEQNYPNVFTQYSKIAETCHRRISNLTEMIEKVRLEKRQMMSPTLSDRENSTAYLNLPPRLEPRSATSDGTAARLNSPNLSMSSNSELEQAELDRKLLETDYVLAESQRKNGVPQHGAGHDPNEDLHTIADIDKDLLERYKLLVDVDTVPNKDSSAEIMEEQFGRRHVVTAEVHAVPKLPNKNVVALDHQQRESTLTLTEAVLETKSNDSANLPYVPLLLDIPRLPKLTTSLERKNADENQDKDIRKAVQLTDANMQTKDASRITKKPPPSKGLGAAQRFNENIMSKAHELSTIVEVDSQLSAKLRPSVSPTFADDATPPSARVFERIIPLVVSQTQQDTVCTSQTITDRDEGKPLSDESLPDILTEVIQQQHIKLVDKGRGKTQPPIQGVTRETPDVKRKVTSRKQLNMYQMSKVLAEQSTDSSTDKSELETVESMLKSMGMGWAVATIRKTQETLIRASSSSSSSLEFCVRQHEHQVSDKSNSTEVSLRHFLDNKVLVATTSSSSKTDTSLSPFIRELQDISAIQGSVASSETKNQRTSTPVHTTKSSEKSRNDGFAAGSDLSSVKSRSEEMFVTVPSDSVTSSDSQSKMVERVD